MKAKPYAIPKRLVWEAYKRVKANGGSAGVDGQSLEDFEKDLSGNLYKLWNRMSSGSYLPKPVRLVEIPKADGGIRTLGIPTVSDRVAQMVAKLVLEPVLEPHFHEDSYGYRPNKSAHDALETTRWRCWRANWVIDLDIERFFDHLDHDLLERALRRHTKCRWLLLYVGRWLRVSGETETGEVIQRRGGTPQGGVISPLLANLFLHYGFDRWMKRQFPSIWFERYADDIVIHASSGKQAQFVLDRVKRRLAECGLSCHPEKTQIVYCKDSDRTEDYPRVSFSFLGYTFQPRLARSREGHFFVSFLPAVSRASQKRIRRAMKEWRIASCRNNQALSEIAELVNPFVRGWIYYYGRFYRSALVPLFNHLNRILIRWVCWKYKRFRGRQRAAYRYLGQIAAREPTLFAHWTFGVKPAVG